MGNKKVSSEKGTEIQKKRGRPAKSELQNTEEKVVEVSQPVETKQDELELLREQIRLLQESINAKDAENKRLLELSARVLDNTDGGVAKEKRTFPVKCLELNGVELSSPNRDTVITLPYDVWVDCDADELAQVFKKISNRTLFEDGICIMGNDGCANFKIKPKVVIDIDAIVKLLDDGDEQALITELNKLTNNQKKASVSHLILYAIVGKSLDGELNRMPRASLEALEMYFGVKLRDCETLLKLFREIKE